MHNITEYGHLGIGELRAELVLITASLSGEYEQLALMLADQQQDYLRTYASSPGSSVAAKNREAQWACSDVNRQIIESRAKLNSLTLARDLIVFLLLSDVPGNVPFAEVASFDNDGLAVP